MYSLNLFKSTFELSAKHTDAAALQARWAEPETLAALHRNAGARPAFLLHDGPPYANGHLHLGHFVNKTLKDATLKFKRLQGYFAPLVPGFDCHGLPVELEVEKLGHTKTDPTAFVAACREYALSQVALQTAEFQSFGVSADWEGAYRTLDPHFEAGAARYFTKLPQVVRRLRPVHWCAACASSLAEAEVEYKPRTSHSVEVLFPVVGAENLFLLVWTTTPYTLPANKAVAFNDKLDYVYVPEAGRTVVRLRRPSDPAHLDPVCLVAGEWTLESPYTGEPVPLVAADYVTSTGTGFVHLAPSFGMDDFRVGEAHGLAVEHFLDNQGRFLPAVRGREQWGAMLAGMTLEQASLHVLDKLAPWVVSRDSLKHDYPHCWRHKSPLFFKASEEWFLDLTALGGTALAALDDVEFLPASGRERLASMLATRTSWCLSRNRLWGTPLVDVQQPDEVAALARVACEGVGAWQDGTPGRRTLDVWFDSGVTHALVMTARFGRTADVYLEGTDQHRGWFQSSLLTAVAAGGPAPYRTVVTHGFVVDEKGQKYSKSSKNYVPLPELFAQYSPDVLRLWALSQDYTGDLRLSQETLTRTVEKYRKLRNTLRFCLQNTEDFDGPDAPLTHPLDVAYGALLGQLREDVVNASNAFDFSAAVTRVTRFCEGASSEYFTAVKDTLYCDTPDAPRRREAQTVLRACYQTLLALLMPVLPFTVEEAFALRAGRRGYFAGACTLLMTLAEVPLPGVSAECGTAEGALMQLEGLRQARRQLHQYVEEHRSASLKSAVSLEVALTWPEACGPLPDPGHARAYLGCATVAVAPGESLTVGLRQTAQSVCPRCRQHEALTEAGLCLRCDTVEKGSLHAAG